jgi:hypothetical protein
MVESETQNPARFRGAPRVAQQARTPCAWRQKNVPHFRGSRPPIWDTSFRPKPPALFVLFFIPNMCFHGVPKIYLGGLEKWTVSLDGPSGSHTTNPASCLPLYTRKAKNGFHFFFFKLRASCLLGRCSTTSIPPGGLYIFSWLRKKLNN